MTKEIDAEDLVVVLNQNDVLCGRGSGPNDYRGNVKFRNFVYERRAEYLAATTRKAKGQIAQEIVDHVRTVLKPPGRFLKKVDPKTVKSLGVSRGAEVWIEVDDETALEKAKQALRQNRDYATNTKTNKPGPGNSNCENNSSNSQATNKGGKNREAQPIIGDMNAQDILRAYAVPCHTSSQSDAYHQMMQPPNFHNNHCENPYMAPQPQNFNGQYQTPPYLNQRGPPGQIHSSVDLENAHIVGIDNQLPWQNGSNQYGMNHPGNMQQPPFGNRHQAPSSHRMPRNVVFPDSVDSADHAALAFANMAVRNKDEDDDNQEDSRKRNKKQSHSGKSPEMFVSDSDSSTILAARNSKVNSENPEVNSPVDHQSASTLGKSQSTFEKSKSSFESSYSSPLALEDYQVIKDAKDEDSRDYSGSVSTMGTIDIPHTYLMQFPSSFQNSQKSLDGKARGASYGLKSSGMSVKSGVSASSRAFSDMSFSVSEVSHDISFSKIAQLSKSSADYDDEYEKVVDTSAMLDKRKQNIGRNVTTPRTWEMMEDDPDELSSLGQASLTILHAAMDASVCSGASHISSNFDSIEEGE